MNGTGWDEFTCLLVIVASATLSRTMQVKEGFINWKKDHGSEGLPKSTA